MPESTPPLVVIVGGGFGGLAAAKALKNTPAQVVLFDRTNHHLFQPLLYQVATATLSPGQIGSPIRDILGKNQNTTVVLGEITGVDKDKKCVLASSADRVAVPIPYDFLILATGVTHSYFGHNEFARFAPGLKSLADAVAIRNKILNAFEQAEAEEDPAWMQLARMFAKVSTVVVGALAPLARAGPGTAPDAVLTRLLTRAKAFVRPVGLLPVAPI